MINPHYLLLIDIQKKSNITVTTVRDVKYLKDEIESFRGLKIGFNTLRRLFGFLKKTAPTTSTLNTLSKYLEYRSFANYISDKFNNEEWYFQQKLLLIQLSKDLTEEDINRINSGIIYRNNIVFVAYFITNLIREDNTTQLNKLFNKLSLDKIPLDDLLQFATIIAHSFYSLNESKALAVYKALIRNDNFRNYVPLLYIDYSNLNAFYFKVLRLIEKHSLINSDLLFVSLMLFYKQFYTAETFTPEKIIRPKNFITFHPVLKGRYFAYKILTSNPVNSTLERLLFIECKTNEVRHFLEEVIPALIIKEEYKILTELSEKFYEEIFESHGWSNNTMNSIYLIALANINWYQNSIKTAKKNLDLIDLDKIELSYYDYTSLFYYQAHVKISHLDNDLKANATAYAALKKVVVKTGFIKFLDVTQKYILN